jgi:transposase
MRSPVVKLFAAGRSQAEVAREPGVARQNASRWHARWQAGGLEALRSAGPIGPAARCRPQLAAIDQALRQGTRGHGFHTDHWTLDRITTVIERPTGVAYHRGHVWKRLRHRLHYRLQRPARRAVERTSGRSPVGWLRTGPRIRAGARRRRAAIVFWDESGVSLLPAVRRTRAPRGDGPTMSIW